MKFNVGDKVIFKKEDRKGVIKHIISSYKVIVTDNNGFDITVSISDIILLDPLTDNKKAYGDLLSNKDINKVNLVSKKLSKKKQCIVDLHIELICADYIFMSNTEIIQQQLNFCRIRIEDILKTNIRSFTIIHGIGEGVLSRSVHDLLAKYNLRYYISLDSGSTVVFL